MELVWPDFCLEYVILPPMHTSKTLDYKVLILYLKHVNSNI